MTGKFSIRELEVFAAVAEELNFGRAARRLHITQPPITRMIKNLEEGLGILLFHRNKRQVSLTSAGEALLHESRHILATIEQSVRRVQDASRGEAGHLKIAFESAALFDVIPKAIKVYQQRYPGVAVTLQNMASSEQVTALYERRIHIGLVGGAIIDRQLRSQTIAREPYVLLLQETHPLAALKQVAMKQLAGESFLMCPRAENPALFDQLIAMCDAAGFRPNIISAPAEMQLIFHLIAEGIGVAVAPSAVARLGMKGVAFKRVTPSLPLSELVVLRRKGDESLIVENFIKVMTSLPAGRRGSANGRDA